MSAIKLHNDDAVNIKVKSDLILTDPPFDMQADQLNRILNNIDSQHLVLITTMRQFIELMRISDWQLSFDFVLDAVIPKKSMNIHQPHYTHATGVYLTKPGAKSLFSRKRRERSDTFDNKGYWPTILRAPRERLGEHGMAKNVQALTDILGSFTITSVYDPFAGSGSVGLAAYELDIDCTLCERDEQYFQQLQRQFRFLA